MIMSIHLIQFAFYEVEATRQMAYFCHLCYEAKEINKTQILMDKICTFSWIKHHEIWICHKDHSWNIVEIFISFMKAYLKFILKISSTSYVSFLC
jgi:hypothetical protein